MPVIETILTYLLRSCRTVSVAFTCDMLEVTPATMAPYSEQEIWDLSPDDDKYL
jgi:hypothetical protein